jgi:hypothetical protein
MKGLIAQRLVLRMFMTLLLTFSVQGIADALIPDVIIRIVPRRTPEPPREDTTVPIATKDDIAISEIMYATDTGGSPQWIELHNRSTRRVSLEGWKVTIENHPEDTTVLATKRTFTLSEEILDADQVLLLVTGQGDNSGVGEATGDLRADSVVSLKDLIGGTQGYRLLSQTAFNVTLKAPTAARTEFETSGDIAGNLGATPEWELPLIEGNQRSSIIREYDSNDITASPYDGTRADGWELASEKGYQYTQGTAYYGHHSDHGTPGYREAAPLPVELSGFRPARGKSSKFRLAREKPTGVIIITWTTQSEMNNTGFFIKRSQRRDGESKIINATMIPGAGTTHEKQFYTYTDTTAQPNVVYYYQLECVSVDGTRRTLTRPIRLRGHIGSSGRRIPYILWAD